MIRIAFIAGAIALSVLVATAGSWLGPLIANAGSSRPAAASAAADAPTPMFVAAPATIAPAAAHIASVAVPSASASWTVVPDTAVSGKQAHFIYSGARWSHVRGFHDARLNGTSSRSDHVGDVATIVFTGSRLALYGVDGRSGGFAKIALDGIPVGEADFFSPTIEPKIVYMTPRLTPGPHKLTIAVSGERPAASDGGFVNINYAKIAP